MIDREAFAHDRFRRLEQSRGGWSITYAGDAGDVTLCDEWLDRLIGRVKRRLQELDVRDEVAAALALDVPTLDEIERGTP